MAGQDFRESMRCFGFFLSWVLAFSVSLLTPMDGARSAQAGESMQGESSGQSIDMDHRDQAEGTVDMMVPHQKHLGPHMKWTELRTANADDTGRADQIVQTLRQTLAKYKDYRVTIDDEYAPLHPDRTPKYYHFANKQRRFQAKVRFQPAEPIALLYRKTGDGYELEGAMYTAPKGMSDDQLNERVPLSVAQWHAHVNLCFQPDGSRRRITRKQLGFKETIATESEYQQAGKRFVPQAGK